MPQDPNPWTIYWQANRRESCIAARHPSDQLEIQRRWHKLAQSLPGESTVVDLAAGNGSVAIAMAEFNETLALTAVDLAAVNPIEYLRDKNSLDRIEFVGNTDIGNLPFDDNVFDCAVSQFGMEYANIDAVALEVSRVVRSKGALVALLHHAESAVIAPSHAQLAELDRLLDDNGVIAAAVQFSRQRLSAGDLDIKGRRYIETETQATPSISGQAFQAIARVVSIESQDKRAAGVLATELKLRASAERTRLRQLQSAALDAQQFSEFKAELNTQGWTTEVSDALTVGGDNPALVGWWLEARKNA